nr:serine-protein kinase ATM-like [Vicugna pacos]XP_031530718.1 serine-protein kinase ATM-like [Vicugna pacos]XP_031530719.1 serine-protein kinase ATM-like [Vicugna pacos]
MSLALNDLLICCRQLEHDRATERRKEVEKFKRLIQDPETIQHLDRHSDSKQGKYLNWDAVFRYSFLIFFLFHFYFCCVFFVCK